jgi:hemoglobin
MKDIETKEDVERMVNGFYTLVNEDPLLGPVFNRVAEVNWKDHLPIMYKFWSSLLLGTGEYKGQPFPKHAVLPIDAAHFERWLLLFEQNLRDQFAGPVAEQAMNQARQIARVFEFKLTQIRS